MKYDRRHYKNNLDYFKTYYKKYHVIRRLKIINYYSKGTMECNCCGEDNVDFLSVDHINNDGAKHKKYDVSAKHIYQWIIKHNFPVGFQILCMNCNVSKGKHGECIHKL